MWIYDVCECCMYVLVCAIWWASVWIYNMVSLRWNSVTIPCTFAAECCIHPMITYIRVVPARCWTSLAVAAAVVTKTKILRKYYFPSTKIMIFKSNILLLVVSGRIFVWQLPFRHLNFRYFLLRHLFFRSTCPSDTCPSFWDTCPSNIQKTDLNHPCFSLLFLYVSVLSVSEKSIQSFYVTNTRNYYTEIIVR